MTEEQVAQELLGLMGGWPRQIDNRLYIIRGGNPCELRSSAAVCSWISRSLCEMLYFLSGPGYVPKTGVRRVLLAHAEPITMEELLRICQSQTDAQPGSGQ